MEASGYGVMFSPEPDNVCVKEEITRNKLDELVYCELRPMCSWKFLLFLDNLNCETIRAVNENVLINILSPYR